MLDFYRKALSRWLVAALAGPLLVLAPLAGAAAQEQSAGVIKETIGAWQINCGKPPGSKNEICAAEQTAVDESRPNVGLTVLFLKSLADGRLLLRVVAPLGVLLPSGLGLKIDQQDVGNAPFIRCSANGCIAEVIVQGDLAQKLKTGKTALFIIFETPSDGIGIPITLDGYEKAVASIK
jgi:invasion protein IalB